MDVRKRHTHLIGTIPAGTPSEAMELALSELGETLDMLGDGETGGRSRWIVPFIEGLRSHPDLELSKDGDWSDVRHAPRFKIRRGHSLRAETLDFGYVNAFRESYPVFEQLVSRTGRANMPFQVGIPGDFVVALTALGLRAAIFGRTPFTEATRQAINEIHTQAGDRVVFQIEVPAELALLALVPKPLDAAVAQYFARVITQLPRLSPVGARFGVHLCLGDLNHKAYSTMRDASPLVHLANAIGRRWPADRRLEFIHAPIAAGQDPPPLESSWYAPLKRLRLPSSTRFIAGFVHEDQDIAAQRKVQAMIESALGTPVDVAAACGLSQRDPNVARALIRRTHELASD